MRGIALAVLVLLGGCAQQLASNETEPEVQEAQQLRDLEAQAGLIVRADGCTQPGQCRTAPVGDRPCGGPRDYVVYCATTTDTVALFRKLEELKRAEQEYNRKHDLVSTCEFRLPPQTELVGTTCRAR